jgi:hypothetical protein
MAPLEELEAFGKCGKVAKPGEYITEEITSCSSWKFLLLM